MINRVMINRLKQPKVMAGLLVFVLCIWMLSGLGKAKPTAKAVVATKTEPEATTVQVSKSQAEFIPAEITLQGQLKPIKVVKIGSETRGKVVQVFVDKGAYVRKDQALVKLDTLDREVKLNEARSLYNQRKSDFESIKVLVAKKVVAKNMLNEKQAQLATAESALKQIQLDIEHTTIRASFDGFVNDRMVEVGDFVNVGDKVAVLVDSKTLLASGYLHSKQLSDLNDKIVVQITPSASSSAVQAGNTPKPMLGKLHFLSKVADANTRSYEVEFKVSNSDLKLLAGTSVDILIQTHARPAHFVSSALLSLNEHGELGIKTVDNANKVEFHVVTPLKSTTEGSWVTGLPNEVQLITVGQGFVNVGDVVNSVAVPEAKSADPLISQNH